MIAAEGAGGISQMPLERAAFSGADDVRRGCAASADYGAGLGVKLMWQTQDLFPAVPGVRHMRDVTVWLEPFKCQVRRLSPCADFAFYRQGVALGDAGVVLPRKHKYR